VDAAVKIGAAAKPPIQICRRAPSPLTSGDRDACHLAFRHPALGEASGPNNWRQGHPQSRGFGKGQITARAAPAQIRAKTRPRGPILLAPRPCHPPAALPGNGPRSQFKHFLSRFSLGPRFSKTVFTQHGALRRVHAACFGAPPHQSGLASPRRRRPPMVNPSSPALIPGAPGMFIPK